MDKTMLLSQRKEGNFLHRRIATFNDDGWIKIASYRKPDYPEYENWNRFPGEEAYVRKSDVKRLFLKMLMEEIKDEKKEFMKGEKK